MAPEPNTDHAGRPQHQGDVAMDQQAMSFSEWMEGFELLHKAHQEACEERDAYAVAFAHFSLESPNDHSLLALSLEKFAAADKAQKEAHVAFRAYPPAPVRS